MGAYSSYMILVKFDKDEKISIDTCVGHMSFCEYIAVICHTVH